jgi:hypothetical protein
MEGEPQVVYQLLQLRELNWTARKERGHWTKWVGVSEVERFETMFVTARRIAADSSATSLGVIHKLYGVGMSPTIGLRGNCRQAFYRCGPALAEALVKAGLRHRRHQGETVKGEPSQFVRLRSR